MNEFFLALEHHWRTAVVVGVFILLAIFIWRRA